MRLDLTPLSNVVKRLDEGLVRYQTNTADTQIRDGLIQRFEFAYELSHKMLRRHLESTAANPTEFDGVDFQYLIRTACEQGLLLSDWPQWRKFRDMRSKTSHTYDEDVALEVVSGIPVFLNDARHLLESLLHKHPQP